MTLEQLIKAHGLSGLTPAYVAEHGLGKSLWTLRRRSEQQQVEAIRIASDKLVRDAARRMLAVEGVAEAEPFWSGVIRLTTESMRTAVVSHDLPDARVREWLES